MLISTFNVYTRPIKADFDSFITRADFDDTNPYLLTQQCWALYEVNNINTPQGLPKLEYRSIFWEKEYMEPQALEDTAR